MSAREGRRFALTVGFAFVALAVLLLWRELPMPGAVAATLGTLLGLMGLVAPTALGPVYRGWMQFALAISKVTTPVLLGIVYFVAFLPIALIMRLVGRRALSHGTADGGTAWHARDVHLGGRSDLTRQF